MRGGISSACGRGASWRFRGKDARLRIGTKGGEEGSSSPTFHVEGALTSWSRVNSRRTAHEGHPIGSASSGHTSHLQDCASLLHAAVINLLSSSSPRCAKRRPRELALLIVCAPCATCPSRSPTNGLAIHDTVDLITSWQHAGNVMGGAGNDSLRPLPNAFVRTMQQLTYSSGSKKPG